MGFVGSGSSIELCLPDELPGLCQSPLLCEPIDRPQRDTELLGDILVLGMLEVLLQPSLLLVRQDDSPELTPHDIS